MMMWLDNVKRALNMELQQIHHLAHLATMAPNEMARHLVLELISEELDEAMFWNYVLCAYSGMTGAGYQPGMPCPGVGPVIGTGPDFLPPSVPIGGPCTGFFPGTGPGILPGIPLSEKEKKEKKE